MNIVIRRALASVSDKAGLADFARALADFGVTFLSTGGTAKLLTEAGVPVTEVSEYTGFPEMLDGRVKTLHPRVHGGLLARRDSPQHMETIRRAGIEPIDLVVVNLYPFARTVAQPGCSLADALENIDIGGPSLLRAAAKNHQGVAVVVDPADYAAIVEDMQANGGAVTPATRFRLAQKAFTHTAAYDAAISNYLTAIGPDGNRGEWPGHLTFQFEKLQDMRYGENPHQAAAFYRDAGEKNHGGIAGYRQIQGKELSYNNLADADAAWECVKTFSEPACVIIKHANPCGVAVGRGPIEAYLGALATDPTSAFGGIIAFNRPLDGKAAAAVAKQFVEVVIAPEVLTEARQALGAKANVRVLEASLGEPRSGNAFDFKRVGGGLLVQTPDRRNVTAGELRAVTKVKPSEAQLTDLVFAWRVAKFVKSNAIVFCSGGRTLGVGAGQMSRVDSARIASIKAQNAGLSLAGSVVASDAFFPFRDGVEVVAQAGAGAIIQPGGSIKDDEVIAAADELGIAMVFTGLRHFRH